MEGNNKSEENYVTNNFEVDVGVETKNISHTCNLFAN